MHPVKVSCTVNGFPMLQKRRCVSGTVAGLLSDLRKANYIPDQAALKVLVNNRPVRYATGHVLKKRDRVRVEAYGE